MRFNRTAPIVAILNRSRERSTVTSSNRRIPSPRRGTWAMTSALDASMTSPNGTIEGHAVSHARHCRQNDIMSAKR
ncbi:MAG: hypothetical protein DWP92_11660 [Armatimonadetes bacterium]|nr:MAG: hypothetical protein DWP92_11660 [Armatimonadota bacterium]